MFGPVPAKYRYIVWACGLMVFAGIGAWTSGLVPVSTPVSATLGVTVGALVVLLFLHDFEHAEHARVRSVRRRLPR